MLDLAYRPSGAALLAAVAGEPATLLPAGFTVLSQEEAPGAKRRLLARRTAERPPAG